MKTNAKKQRVWLGTLGILLLTAFVACQKKNDPAAADSGGGAAPQRNVITMQGAAR